MGRLSEWLQVAFVYVCAYMSGKNSESQAIIAHSCVHTCAGGVVVGMFKGKPTPGKINKFT